MTYNQIVRKITVGKIIKAGKEITVSVATQTTSWVRHESVAQQQGERWLKTVDDLKDTLPEGTVDVCQREAEHKSDDVRDHFTGVCFDGKTGKSLHFPIKKD
ncbi:hypothetical protein FQN55_005505 [Onygenales sp. PD_40]|nr:hypothetical protein FQN55_005505 [Onygenales sp. PD_40]KAK2797944.1 hypothetical protein FQN51_008123 [Onygenales sp. PD_10]